MLVYFWRDVNKKFQTIWNLESEKALTDPDPFRTNDGFPRTPGRALVGRYVFR